MNLRAWMLVLAVPVIAFGAGLGIQADLNSELRTAVRKQFPNADQARVSQVTVTQLCESPDTSIGDMCFTDGMLQSMKNGSVVAAAGGVLLLATIAICGFVARTHRKVLLALFRPGLYLTAAAVTALILVHGLLAI